MAKSDSFFLRADAIATGTFAQTEIDLGSFVNLGISKSTLLRIHNIQVQYADGGTTISPETNIYANVATGAKVAWQLTTQTKGGLVRASDKSFISGGGLTLAGDPNSTAHFLASMESEDVNPQHWRNGYLVGVDAIYLGVETGYTIASGDCTVSIVIECTLETATQASSTALALSQQ